MNNFKGSRQKFLSLFPILLPALAGGLVLIFGILPFFRQIIIGHGELSENRRKSVDLDAKIRTLQSLSPEDSSSTLIKLELLLPSKAEIPFLLTNLENLITADSIKVASLNFTGSDALAEEKIRLGFSVSGSNFALVKFLGDLKRLVPSVEVVSLKVSAVEGSPEKSMVFDISSPIAALPKTVGRIEEPLLMLSTAQEKLLQTLTEYHFPEIIDYSVMSPSLPAGKQNPF